MKQVLSLLTAVAIATTMASVTFAQAVDGTSHVNGIAVKGNTTTVFQAANDSDLQMDSLTRWSSFAQQHPKVARQSAISPNRSTMPVICGSIQTWRNCSRTIPIYLPR
jgi:hypothetical protein